MQHEEITKAAIGCAYRVYNKIGFGFLESVYERCMMIELEKTVELQAKQIEQLEARLKSQGERISELEKENHNLYRENKDLGAERDFFKKGSEKLKGQVVELGEVPVWSP